MKIDLILHNSKLLLQKMTAGCQYTFHELADLCECEGSILCMTLLHLIREGSMVQYRTDEVYYALRCHSN